LSAGIASRGLPMIHIAVYVKSFWKFCNYCLTLRVTGLYFFFVTMPFLVIAPTNVKRGKVCNSIRTLVGVVVQNFTFGYRFLNKSELDK